MSPAVTFSLTAHVSSAPSVHAPWLPLRAGGGTAAAAAAVAAAAATTSTATAAAAAAQRPLPPPLLLPPLLLLLLPPPPPPLPPPPPPPLQLQQQLPLCALHVPSPACECISAEQSSAMRSLSLPPQRCRVPTGSPQLATPQRGFSASALPGSLGPYIYCITQLIPAGWKPVPQCPMPHACFGLYAQGDGTGKKAGMYSYECCHFLETCLVEFSIKLVCVLFRERPISAAQRVCYAARLLPQFGGRIGGQRV
jgi:hypothetical protein